VGGGERIFSTMWNRFDETFSLVVKYDSIKIVLTIVAVEDLDLTQLINIDQNCLLVYRLERRYLYVPTRGFHIQRTRGEGMFTKEKLKYSLKQMAREWNKKFNDFLISYNLQPNNVNPCVYVNKGHTRMMTTIFVNDKLVCSDKNSGQKDHMIEKMKEEFEVTTNNANVYVGLHIFRNRTKLKLLIGQVMYVSKIFKHLGFENATLVNIPANPNIHLEYSLTNKMGKNLFFTLKQ
jgi:hypothetical protein